LLQYSTVLFALSIVLLTFWYFYYRVYKSAKVKLYYKHNAFNDFLIDNTPEFMKTYSSTPYLLNGNLQTLFFRFKQRMVHCPFIIKYERQLITLSDGGQLSLDWPIFPEVDKKFTNSSPLLVVLAGMASGRNDLSVNTLIEAAAKRGFKSVLVNHRGCSKTPLLVLYFIT
jgi:predicted alpha/beta-fold hydrolase